MAPPLGGVRDEESIKSPVKSPGKDAGPDPLQAFAAAPTEQQASGLWVVWGV